MERGVRGGSVVGTLLGPERAGNRFFSFRADLRSYRCAPCGVGQVWRLSRVGVWLYVENCTVDASIFFVYVSVKRQANKGARWMPWHQEPMKDVGACDKPRGVGNQTLIRGFPNRET